MQWQKEKRQQDKKWARKYHKEN